MHSPRTERLIVISLVMVTTGISLPTYAKLVAKITARGVDLSWHQHLALLGMAVLIGMAGVVLCGLVVAILVWLLEGTYWLWSGVQIWRRQRRRNSARRHAANRPPDGS